MPTKVEIHDLNGKFIKSIKEYSGEQIDVLEFPKGVCFVKLFNEKEVSVGKLVVE